MMPIAGMLNANMHTMRPADMVCMQRALEHQRRRTEEGWQPPPVDADNEPRLLSVAAGHHLCLMGVGGPGTAGRL